MSDTVAPTVIAPGTRAPSHDAPGTVRHARTGKRPRQDLSASLNRLREDGGQMLHFVTLSSRYLLCGDEIGSETVSIRPQDTTCPACRDIINEWARGTVARSMRRRQMVQAQAAIANDVLWRRGYPLPDGFPIQTCEHMRFAASVEASRLTEVDDGPVTGYSADIKVQCADCGLPFRFIGLPGGLEPDQPTTSLAGDELRAPLEPMPVHLADRVQRSRQASSDALIRS